MSAKLGKNIFRIVKLGAQSLKRYAKVGMQNFRILAKTTAKNTAASAKKLAQLAAKNKKMTAAVAVLAGVGAVGIREKVILEEQKIRIKAFVDTKVSGKDSTGIILDTRGVLPVGSTIYFESADGFASVPLIIKNLLKSGTYKNLELEDSEIAVYVENVLAILKDKQDQIISIDDNYDPVTTIDSFNPTMKIDNVEKENEVQLYDLLTECANKSELYLKIEVSVGQAMKQGAKKTLDTGLQTVLDVLPTIPDAMKKYIVYAKYALIVIVALGVFSILSYVNVSFAVSVAVVVAFFLYTYLFY
jgi:hypothetical protein